MEPKQCPIRLGVECRGKECAWWTSIPAKIEPTEKGPVWTTKEDCAIVILALRDANGRIS